MNRGDLLRLQTAVQELQLIGLIQDLSHITKDFWSSLVGWLRFKLILVGLIPVERLLKLWRSV